MEKRSHYILKNRTYRLKKIPKTKKRGFNVSQRIKIKRVLGTLKSKII